MRSSSTALLLGLALTACGGDDGPGHLSDAPIAIDAPPDVPPDVPTDAPPPPMNHHHYVMDSMHVPVNNTEARTYGMDLNNDGTVDNQLGMVLATLSGMGFDIQTATQATIDRGQVLHLFDLGADNFTTAASATVNSFIGATPMPPACNNANDTVCRHHLTGAGTFTIAPASPMNTALMGTIANGKLNVGPGHLVAPLTMFGGATPIYITLIGARVQATAISGTSLMAMKIAGGVSQTDIDMKVIPAMRDGFQMTVMRDCTALTSPPACGCAQGSSGKQLLSLFDTAPQDCTISLSEVQNNSLIQSLLAPDVMIEGQMALSYGVGATAVGAGFVGP